MQKQILLCVLACIICNQLLLNSGMLYDIRSMVKYPQGPVGSVHDFKNNTPTKRKDYILVSKGIKPLNYTIDDTQLQTRKWQSDHLPVWSELKL